MHTVQCENEIFQQLGDINTKLVMQAMQQGIIDSDTKTFLMPDHPVTTIYILPKVHKYPLHPPGRP